MPCAKPLHRDQETRHQGCPEVSAPQEPPHQRNSQLPNLAMPKPEMRTESFQMVAGGQRRPWDRYNYRNARCFVASHQLEKCARPKEEQVGDEGLDLRETLASPTK